MITECINEDCYELTENIGGLCKACMGLAQKRAEMARKSSQNGRSGSLSDKTGDRWLDGNTAPKDGNQFLADIGYGFAVVAAWNEIGRNFVYADLQAINDHAQLDVWWETEWCGVVIERWMPMPEVK